MSELLVVSTDQWAQSLDTIDKLYGIKLARLRPVEWREAMMEAVGLTQAQWVAEHDVMVLSFIDYHHASAFSRGDFGGD